MIKTKKSLGQNFLTSKNIVDDIVRFADTGTDDVVLEVGPGKGILTEALLRTAKRILAVEKDDDLIELLKEKFKKEIKSKKLILVHGDILSFDNTKYKILDTKYKIIANIPYYLTGRLFRKFLENPPAGGQPSVMILMIQKEVGGRIVCTKKNSILSISIKAYGEPKIVKNVSAKHFLPQPKVNSVVLKIDNISKKFFKILCANLEIAQCEQKFFKLVKQGFLSKRKMLKNNLNLGVELLSKCKIPEKSRAENLSLEDWKCLYKTLKQ